MDCKVIGDGRTTLKFIWEWKLGNKGILYQGDIFEDYKIDLVFYWKIFTNCL